MVLRQGHVEIRDARPQCATGSNFDFCDVCRVLSCINTVFPTLQSRLLQWRLRHSLHYTWLTESAPDSFQLFNRQISTLRPVWSHEPGSEDGLNSQDFDKPWPLHALQRVRPRAPHAKHGEDGETPLKQPPTCRMGQLIMDTHVPWPTLLHQAQNVYSTHLSSAFATFTWIIACPITCGALPRHGVMGNKCSEPCR